MSILNAKFIKDQFKPEITLGYKAEKMSDDEFLMNRHLLKKIKIVTENKELCNTNTRDETKGIIKRDIIY